ncbi:MULTISPECIES: ROK family protein [unclassified Novosphingobium]|uniref:ROK family protein n=1 Tax=unclassified Novosphingobium TaxID=2644732 RepID=UPI00135CEC5A|nr:MULTISPECIES: ROK family protein [unclassified Novosphingobium]
MAFPLRLNETHRRLLALIRRHHPVSRAQLGKIAGLGSGPVTQITRDLLLAGLIHEGERIKGGRGQPALPLMLDPGGALSFGVGMIPGKLRIVAIDFCGQVVDEGVVETTENSPESIAGIVAPEIDRICRKLGVLDRSRVLGVGFALPGFFAQDHDRMHVVDAHADWRSRPLSAIFSDVIGLPCWIENDATAAAVAEFYQQRDFADCMITLMINYGIGGGIVVGGQPFRGGFGNAGEIGAFFPLDQPRPSGTDLLHRLREAGVEISSLSDIAYRTERERSVCDTWAQRAGEQLRQLVSSAWSWFDPQLVVVAGALPSDLLDQVVAAIAADSIFGLDPRRSHPKVRASTIGPSVAAIGAAHIPLHEFTRTAPI